MYYRGGTKRLSALMYEETRNIIRSRLEDLMRDSVTYMEHARRKTIRVEDVVYSIKRQGKNFYGGEVRNAPKRSKNTVGKRKTSVSIAAPDEIVPDIPPLAEIPITIPKPASKMQKELQEFNKSP
jgi:hypothetical protein